VDTFAYRAIEISSKSGLNRRHYTYRSARTRYTTFQFGWVALEFMRLRDWYFGEIVKYQSRLTHDLRRMTFGLHQPRLGELNFISGIVIHAEIAVSPRFERDPLGQMSTACLKLGVQRIEVLRKDVNPYA
jgi:hypothetical protein